MKSLFDADYRADMLSRVQLQQLALRDNIASARLFDRLIQTFLSTCLGFDQQTCRPKKDGGLLGHVRAYFGMVETQGRGTLHLHSIIWLYVCMYVCIVFISHE